MASPDLPSPLPPAPPAPADERRSAPRRRLRDRIASLDRTSNPALHGHHELRNLLLLVDDDLRQTALALGDVERFTNRSMELLEDEEVTAETLSAHATDGAVLDRLDALSENLANLRRRMTMIASSIKQAPRRRAGV